MFCVKKKSLLSCKQEFNNGDEKYRDAIVEAKCNVGGGKKNVFPESLLWEEKDFQECLFYVPNYVKCFIKWSCATRLRQELGFEKVGWWVRKHPSGRLVPWVRESAACFEMGFYRIFSDSVEKETTNIVFVGLLTVLEKAEYSLT